MMDMTDLQGDGAQDTERMTDPRAALADDLGHDLWYLQDKAHRRGVLLVSKELVDALAAAIANLSGTVWGDRPTGDYAKRIDRLKKAAAALSAED
jgi:hypothetical protein